MNKSKKELYEENKKLKNTLKTYTNFWEVDVIEECTKQLNFAKKSMYITSVVLLIISAFLLGLSL